MLAVSQPTKLGIPALFMLLLPFLSGCGAIIGAECSNVSAELSPNQTLLDLARLNFGELCAQARGKVVGSKCEDWVELPEVLSVALPDSLGSMRCGHLAVRGDAMRFPAIVGLLSKSPEHPARIWGCQSTAGHMECGQVGEMMPFNALRYSWGSDSEITVTLTKQHAIMIVQTKCEGDLSNK